jgi:hypothetical protein
MNENNINKNLTEEEKEEELIKTIKMEPILETTELKEDEAITNKKKKIKRTDIILVLVIIVLLLIVGFIVYKKLL